MAARRISNNTPVRVVNPSGVNSQYNNHLGVIKKSVLMWGGTWDYTVVLNNGRRINLLRSEFKVL